MKIIQWYEGIISRCGRVVKASDSKSDSLWERRFESYHLRKAAELIGSFYSDCFLNKFQNKLTNLKC